nr:hypothetical protein [Tanacetum cinerariifolium]
MVMQNQSELGEGSEMPTDPHHTPTILQPSSSQPQKTQKPRKPTRKDTQVPQPSGLTDNIVNEAVYKELGDRLVRAATTTSSLEAKQDSESFGDKSLGKDASKQERRIDAIDADDEIILVNDVDNRMFDVDDLSGEEVFVARQNENVVEEVVDVAQVSTTVTTTTITTEEINLAQTLEALKTSKPKVKWIVFQEPRKYTTTTTISSQKSHDNEQEANIALIETWDDIQAKIDVDHQLAERLQVQEQEELGDEEKATLFQQLLEKRRRHFIAKRAEEKRNKPLTQAQKRNIMCTYLKNMEGYTLKQLKLKEFNKIQEMFDRAFKRVNTFEDFRTELVERKEKIVGEELEQEITKNQKIHKEGKKSYYQIVRADGKSQMYMFFSQMLKSFNKEDLEDCYKLVKARYGSIRPVENMDYLLWSDMKLMNEPHVEDEVWKRQQGYTVLEWKLYDSCRVHSLMMQSMQIYMLVEKNLRGKEVYGSILLVMVKLLMKKLNDFEEVYQV